MRIQLPLKSVRTDLCALRVAPMTESRLHCLQPLIHRTRNDRNQDPYQGCMGDLPQIQTRVDMKNYMLKHRLRLFGATISPTVCYAAGTWAPNKEHARTIQSTQRKMLRLIIETKRKYKKIEKQDIGPKEENGEVDINEMCSTDDESGDGQSTTTQNDVDGEVSFEDDADEETDTTVIEEEDWIEYIKRSTEDAMEKMERAKIRCWNRTHKK